MDITISEDTAMTIIKLAAEDNISAAKLLEQLVKHEDSERHVQFQPGKGHVRVKCRRKNCKETGTEISAYDN